MAGPSWPRWVLAAVFLAVAGYCVVRLVAAHRAPVGYHGCHRALDVAHLVMGLGMAVMCSPVGGPVPAAGWQTVFVLLAAWFLGSAVHRGRTGRRAEPIGWHGGGLHHAIGALAMLYMLGTMPADPLHMATPWMAGMSGAAGLPVLGWLFATYFAGFALLLAPRAVRAPAAVPVPGRLPAVLRAPRIPAACQLVMAVGMGYLIAPLG
ncbi:MAG TPA: DUF5134 domain-containing protein [Actinophytocola sp.]|uniref:DUF5134 domain-containing protein n=1 Tax=Actinophytocola sp. TaxID=1872138 RepID=UPI002DDD1360|nr:DUF5134 domain-containing protein [Actinophytocola sp.]HEV2781018.1 DUF5134 domain-containing protein [Actinophytocola sp.]